MIIPLFYATSRRGIGLLLMGGLCMLFGFLIIIHPEILIWVIAALLISVGFLLFSLWLARYQAQKRSGHQPHVEFTQFWDHK